MKTKIILLIFLLIGNINSLYANNDSNNQLNQEQKVSKNISYFNLAMIEATDKKYLMAIDYLKQINTSNNILFFKTQFFSSLFQYLEYNRIHVFQSELLKIKKDLENVKDLYKNEELINIYMSILIELKKSKINLSFKKEINTLQNIITINNSNEAKRKISILFVYQNKIKEAIKFYSNTIDYDKKVLAILYILNKNFVKAKETLLYLDKKKLSPKFNYIKLFTLIQTNDKQAILDFLLKNKKNLKKILSFSNQYPITLKEKKDFYDFRKRKRDFLDFRKTHNPIFVDFLLAKAPFLHNKNYKYIAVKDVYNGINTKKIKNKDIGLLINDQLKVLSKKNIDPYKKLQLFKKFETLGEPDGYYYYNLGILYAQVKNYQQAYNNFYKSFFMNPKIELAGTYLSIIGKFKLKLNEDFFSLVSEILNKKQNSDNSARLIFNFFFQSTISPYIIKKNNYFMFVENYIYFLKTHNSQYLQLTLRNNTDNTSKIMYLIYKNIYKNNFDFISFIQDNIEIKKDLYSFSPTVIGQLYIKLLFICRFQNKIKDLDFLSNKNTNFLRLYSFLKVLNKQYEEAKSLFVFLNKNYNIKDVDFFYNELITYINLNDKKKVNLLIVKGTNYFKIKELILFKSILYLNSSNISVFKALIQKSVNSRHNLFYLQLNNTKNIILQKKD